MEESKKYSLNKKDAASIGRGTLYAAGGAVCVYLLSVLTQIDFGPAFTPAIVAIASVGLNFGIKYFKGKSE